MNLDLSTLSVTLSCVAAMSFLVMLIIWRINRRLPGVFCWMLSSLMIGLSFLAIFLAEVLRMPVHYAAFISNALSLPAVFVALEGCLRFRGHYSFLRWRVGLLAIPVFVLLAWLNRNDPQARYLFHDAVAALALLAIAGVMTWRVRDTRERLAYSLVAFSGLLLSIAFMARWTVVFTAAEPEMMTVDMPANLSLFFVLILFSIGWTYGVSVACYYRSHEQVMQLAREDTLTGLPNRRSIDEVLGRAVNESRRTGRRFGVIILDVNDFKTVNDKLGHGVGDELLTAIAGRLQSFVRGADFTGRLGGDEFIIIVHDMDSPDRSEIMLQRVRENMNGTIALPDGQQFEVTVSLGMAIWSLDGESADKLLTVADRRMYQDKREFMRHSSNHEQRPPLVPPEAGPEPDASPAS